MFNLLVFVYKICFPCPPNFVIDCTIYTILQKKWPECYQLAGAVGFKFPYFAKTPLSDVVPQACYTSVNLMDDLLEWNPAHRPTAQAALKHQFFQVNPTYQTLCHGVQL